MHHSLPEELKEIIRNHYEGNKRLPYELALAILNDISEDEDTSMFYFFGVPSYYRSAYRILANVSKQDMKELIGEVPKKKKGMKYIDKLTNEVSSWTVDGESFHNGMIGVDGIGKRPANKKYTVMLETKPSSSFIFNPKRLPEEVGASAFSDEQEIIGVGDIEDVSVAYRENGVDEDYDMILEELEDM